MSKALSLTEELLRRPSVSPEDHGCLEIIGARLEPLGFSNQHLRYGPVDNLWARRGQAAPILCFAGHTDVVPAGPRDDWQTDPFEPVVRDGVLYGRGSADMKSGLAAMVTAAERFVSRHPEHGGSLAFLLTSDEEGPPSRADDGPCLVTPCVRAGRPAQSVVGVSTGLRGIISSRM